MRICSLTAAVALGAVLAANPVLGQQAGQPDRPAQSPQSTSSGIVERLLNDPPPDEQVIARYDQAALTREQLLDFLVQTRGLDALLNLMQLQIARALAEQENIRVTERDIQRETQQTLEQAFAGVAEITEEQYEDLLAQLLARQQLSRAEFDVVMATNAYLRALARPRIEALLTEENVRRAFNARYGEQVRVRHIQLDNLSQVAEVNRRLQAGEEFTALASELSRNPETREVGGALPPFSLQSDIPEPFKEAAYGLEIGEVSDPVEAGGYYHVIKLVERIPPQAVEFENVQEQLKEQLADEQLLVVTTKLRRLLAQMLGSGNLEIRDPVLARQLQARLAALQPQPMSPEEMRRRMEAEREGKAEGR